MALRDDLYAWLTAQDAWQQDLAKRLIGRTQLDGHEYEKALRVVKAAFSALADNEDAPATETLALDDLPTEALNGAPRLLAFGRLRGVGAVASEHQLRFAGDGLTVIYGQNAAGKTTYVRALKRLCRTVDREAEVRGNVFVSRPGVAAVPTATVEIVVAGEQRGQQLNLADPPDLGLDAISVFDSRCAELYIDTHNAVAYVPSALLLLARLAALQDRMRGDLQRESQSLLGQQPDFSEFETPTAVKTYLDGISASSGMDEAPQLASISDSEQLRLTELRAVVASRAARSFRADAHAATHDAAQARALGGQLRQLRSRLETSAVERLRGLAGAAAETEQAVALAAQEFADLPVDGVGTSPWRQLWRAAREFSAATAVTFPPSAEEHCPLCLQQLSNQAAERLSHFERHIRGTLGEQAEQAQAALQAALEALDTAHATQCRTDFLGGLAEREPELHSELERFIETVEEQSRALRREPQTAEVRAPALDSIEHLSAWAHSREDHAETLRAAEDPNRERELRQELAELEARAKLLGRLDDVTAWLTILRRTAALERARSALATNRITIKQRELSETVVTGALDAKLQEELRNLGCRNLPVDLHPQTAIGETQVGLRLAGAHGAPRVSDIASEGEQRALSLSFFLAEVASSEADGGIVVDDPVSSLDDERRAYIAKRLVEEAGSRQVIVFTHDLPFMLDLVERAEQSGTSLLVQGVWRMGSEVGRVDDHPPFKAMKLRARVGVLTSDVEQWNSQPEAQTFDEAWRRVCDFYSRLRITWERAVEERLFRGVVQRFQREVRTLALDDVVVSTELVGAIKEGMTRCSQFVHDEPPGTATALPGRTDLAADLNKIQEFERQTRS